YIAQEKTNQNRFMEWLGQLRAQCDEIIKREPGEHGGTNHQNIHAARASLFILEEAANHTGNELELGCSETSNFVRIAALFLEAVTGKYDAAVRRQCEAVKAELHAKI